MADKSEVLISTAAEAHEASALPRLHEVHTDPEVNGATQADLPASMQGPTDGKSPARWAYERLILYIQNFEKQLDNEQEVAVGFAGSETGILRIEGLGYFDPDIITFFGSDERGNRTQLIQHVSQLSVMLRALPKQSDRTKPLRIGFQLARDLQNATG